MLTDARQDLTALAAFRPPTGQALEHQPAGAGQQEIKGRPNVVGIFPDDAAVLRLPGPC